MYHVCPTGLWSFSCVILSEWPRIRQKPTCTPGTWPLSGPPTCSGVLMKNQCVSDMCSCELRDTLPAFILREKKYYIYKLLKVTVILIYIVCDSITLYSAPLPLLTCSLFLFCFTLFFCCFHPFLLLL